METLVHETVPALLLDAFKMLGLKESPPPSPGSPSPTLNCAAEHFFVDDLDTALQTSTLLRKARQTSTRFVDFFLNKEMALKGDWIKIRRHPDGTEEYRCKRATTFTSENCIEFQLTTTSIETQSASAAHADCFLTVAVERIEHRIDENNAIWIDASKAIVMEVDGPAFLAGDFAARTEGPFYLSGGLLFTSPEARQELLRHVGLRDKDLELVPSKAFFHCYDDAIKERYSLDSLDELDKCILAVNPMPLELHLNPAATDVRGELTRWLTFWLENMACKEQLERLLQAAEEALVQCATVSDLLALPPSRVIGDAVNYTELHESRSMLYGLMHCGRSQTGSTPLDLQLEEGVLEASLAKYNMLSLYHAEYDLRRRIKKDPKAANRNKARRLMKCIHSLLNERQFIQCGCTRFQMANSRTTSFFAK